MAIVKRILFVLFWEVIALLVVLIIKPAYYIPWLIICLILFFVLTYISLRFIPSKKDKKKLIELSKEYKEMMKKDFNVKTKAELLEFTCPSCEHVTSFWQFIKEDKCPKCDSKLWTTRIMETGNEYYELFIETEEIERFLSGLSFRQKNKLKKLMLEI